VGGEWKQKSWVLLQIWLASEHLLIQYVSPFVWALLSFGSDSGVIAHPEGQFGV